MEPRPMFSATRTTMGFAVARRPVIPPTARLLPLLIKLVVVWCRLSESHAANSNETIKRVLVDLPSLPAPFADDKLPVVLDKARECYTMVGCFEPVPITSDPSMDPFETKTEFLMYARNTSMTAIKFEEVENCLESNGETCAKYPFDLQALSDSPFEPSKRTIILVSGFLTQAPTDWEIGSRDIWLQLEDVNVIVVNWSHSNKGSYPLVATKTRLVSRQITVLLYYLASLTGLDLSDDSFAEKIYMVGHSLGAHIAGFVGMDLGGAMGRITGLDPAGPNFDELPARFRLDRSDAQLVDAIHSNGGAVLFSTRPRYGTGLMSGHVDFYANDGSHQPACKTDLAGCSHGKSNKYYMAFLQHELSMRNYLGENYTSLYRLNAYTADQYNKFQNATSLLGACPNSLINEYDFYSPDLDRCTVPVDFFSWYSSVKKELQEKHGIDFSRESRRNNSYYFFTDANTDDQMDHYLMKVLLGKETQSKTKSLEHSNSWKASSYQEKECDISFDIKLKGGLGNVHKIEQYRLLDGQEQYKIVAPYLSASVRSKYELSLLDSQDFYLASGDKSDATPFDEIKLRQNLLDIFPESITLRGFHLDEEAADKRRKKRENPGFLKTISNIYHMMRGNSTAEDEEIRDVISCKLSVQRLVVRPLRRFHRMIVAYYSATLPENTTRPKIVVLNDDRLLREFVNASNSSPAADTSTLLLDSVFIGPYDRSFVVASKQPDDDDDDDNDDEKLTSSSNAHMDDLSSQLSSTVWVTLTVVLLVSILAVASISWFNIRRVDARDKEALIMSPVLVIHQPSRDHNEFGS